MTISTDVLVVGGGATGTGVARDLALRGVDVLLVDRGGLGSGTSGRSHGVLHSGARYPDDDRRGARECAAENRILREIAGACVRDTGGLFVQLAADDAAYFETKVDACREAGVAARIVDGDEARAAVPGIADGVERALRVRDAVVYPSRLVAANAAAARERGATIRTRAPLEDLHVDGGRIAAATVGGRVDDRIEADYVVNAAGAWAGDCAALAGVPVEMRPTTGVMVAVDYPDLGPVLNRCRPPTDGDIVVPHREEVVLGTTSVAVDDPDDFEETSSDVERVREECAAMLPALESAPTTRAYWGVRPLYEPDEAARGTRDGGEGDARGISRGFFLLDHADDGVEGFASVVGGKLTTYRLMAEATADRVCEALGVDADCRTDEVRLPGADDPDRLDAFVEEFDAGGPADADVVGPE